MSLKTCVEWAFLDTRHWWKSKITLPIKTEIQINKYSTEIKSASDEYIIRSPYKIEIPKKTYTELIWERHSKWKNHEAVVCGLTNKKYTFTDLKEYSTIIGKCLVNEGLCGGDVIAILLPNSPEYISIILGASGRGLTICSINPLYTPDEISHQLKNSGAKKVITFPHKVQDVMKAVDNLKMTKCLPPNFKVLSIRIDEQSSPNLPKEIISLNDLVNRLAVTNSPKTVPSSIADDSLAFISHSSGTTGLPKGVCLTHRNVTASILQMMEGHTTFFKETNDNHQDVIPMFLPIFHNYALEMTLCALYNGSKLVTLPKFEEKTFLSTLKQHKATILFVVPPTILFLGSNPLVTEDHLKYLKVICTAAAPVGKDDIDRCLKKALKNINFIHAYGQTEAMCCLTHTPYGDKNYSSVGKALANTELKIIDLQTGHPKGPNEEGELCFKGPQMSLGYLNNPDATKEAIDSEGWFHTGDVGYYDKDGFFYIVDRIKEMVKVKGFQVAPAELEHILRSKPEIEAAGVIGIPDTRKGEALVAFIKKKEGSSITESAIREFLAGKVAPFKLIEKYIYVDSIPTTQSGKILRKELKKMYGSMA
ncbi:uncharacterized protein [Halyomorpha halys]|uniref:uncharacterized protein n=1 Tax=Halyomorpha halys TaxID=286706 RepID=UPI0006D4E6D5|nr:4-coumarate--CoA ligase 1-like [Halyomorpha halys]XP_014271605.1 4-coumarate--CoA ligase 1-like [Halyomorpha halys]XP_014271606.1 4-coumarate--CoA ligase 1-like [Halyomorpha halys]XP_014271608.1 4-coumarate--CoA ligase 1-like [Halyomorpha halys]XP_024217130.1 4-coumarate--CoA ligase 1-like [Halyomorpha halys]